MTLDVILPKNGYLFRAIAFSGYLMRRERTAEAQRTQRKRRKRCFDLI
ncbi:hypothetical protein [Anabaena sp. UHCC 0204]|nr:hypothetical protein [Anabaena sp. UHCC 0204]